MKEIIWWLFVVVTSSLGLCMCSYVSGLCFSRGWHKGKREFLIDLENGHIREDTSNG